MSSTSYVVGQLTNDDFTMDYNHDPPRMRYWEKVLKLEKKDDILCYLANIRSTISSRTNCTMSKYLYCVGRYEDRLLSHYIRTYAPGRNDYELRNSRYIDLGGWDVFDGGKINLTPYEEEMNSLPTEGKRRRYAINKMCAILKEMEGYVGNMEVLRLMSAEIDDLQNFICDYTTNKWYIVTE